MLKSQKVDNNDDHKAAKREILRREAQEFFGLPAEEIDALIDA